MLFSRFHHISVGRKRFYNHMMELHKTYPTCDQCNQQFADFDYFTKHMKSHRKKSTSCKTVASCSQCGRKFRQNAVIQKTSCGKCTAGSVVNTTPLKDIMNFKPQIPRRKSDVRQTSDAPTTIQQRASNVDVSAQKQYGGKCDKCSTEFADLAALKKHMKYKHRMEKPGLEVFACQHCVLENNAQKPFNSISFFR